MADPPGERDEGAAGTGGARDARGARSRLESGFERALSLSRVVVIVPVIILLLAAISSFAYGTDVFVRSVANVVGQRPPRRRKECQLVCLVCRRGPWLDSAWHPVGGANGGGGTAPDGMRA